MKAHFLQSKAWEDFQNSIGRQTLRLKDKNYSTLAVLEKTPLGNYLFCPYGPTCQKNSKESLKEALATLKKLAKSKNAIFIRVEPTFPLENAEIKALGLKKSKNINPAYTQILDLRPPKDEILAAMRQDKRNVYRNYTKKGLKIRLSKNPEKDLKILTDLLAKTSEKNHFSPHESAYLAAQLKTGFAKLYLADYQEKSIAAAIVYDHNDIRYYAHAASDFEYRKLAAGTALVAQMIFDAKSAGAHSFDFWGVTASNSPRDPWFGFTKFKQSFGGALITYAGTYDLVLNPLKYHLYKLIRPLNRSLRKLAGHR